MTKVFKLSLPENGTRIFSENEAGELVALHILGLLCEELPLEQSEPAPSGQPVPMNSAAPHFVSGMSSAAPTIVPIEEPMEYDTVSDDYGYEETRAAAFAAAQAYGQEAEQTDPLFVRDDLEDFDPYEGTTLPPLGSRRSGEQISSLQIQSPQQYSGAVHPAQPAQGGYIHPSAPDVRYAAATQATQATEATQAAQRDQQPQRTSVPQQVQPEHPPVQATQAQTRVTIHKVENEFMVKSDILILPANSLLKNDDPLLDRMTRGQVQDELDEIARPVLMGNVYATSSGPVSPHGVQAKCLFHAVVASPTRIVNEQEISQSLNRALLKADFGKAKTIAIIPADCGNLDLHQAAIAQLKTVKLYLKTRPDTGIQRIFFVMRDDESIAIYQSYFDRVFR